MTSCRLLLWALAAILPCQLFVLPSSQFAQPRPKLSSAQEQLQAAVENLDAAAIREAVRAGADPNYRYGGRGRSVLGLVGAKQLWFHASRLVLRQRND